MFVKKEARSERRNADILIHNYSIPGGRTPFSIAFSELDGTHSLTKSETSDRAYLFVDGSAEVTVGDQTRSVEAEDVVYIQKGTWHAIRGKARYFVINDPPFDPSEEKKA